MDNMIKQSYFLSILTLSLIAVAYDAAAETLEHAWLVVNAEDMTIEAAQIRVRAAEAELAAAQGSRWPSLVARASATRYNETPAFDFGATGIPGQLPLFDGSSQLMADARVTLPVLTFGVISNGVQAAESSVRAQRQGARVHAQDIRLAVAAIYIDVLRASSTLAVADSRTRSLESHVADVTDMYQTGAVARNDLLAAEVLLADVRQRRLQAQNGVELSKAAYNRALGRQLTASVDLDENLPALDSRLNADSLPSLTETALATRAELAALQSAAEAARAQAESTRARSRPQLALVGSYATLENNFLNRQDFWSLALGVEWAVFDANRSRDQANALSLRSTAFYREYRDLQSVVELQVHSAWLQFNEAGSRVELTQRAIGQSEENLRVARDRYRNGEGTNTEVLDAEDLHTLSQSNYDNARYDAAYARYRLARAAGLL
ncbi:MAG: hypothetical protein BMS9Abin32_244 [Gammaproteobacteria bacterium]|nr:MAG: hypothetical protein BMS9Abin32_244 [Gammaproteobacteria bacterium]